MVLHHFDIHLEYSDIDCEDYCGLSAINVLILAYFLNTLKYENEL
jgi:hypothetical protein